MDEETVRKLMWLNERRETLNDWERSLVEDRIEMLKKYKSRTASSRKQVKCIQDIFHRLKFDAEIEQTLSTPQVEA